MFNYFYFNNKKSIDMDIYMLKGFELPIPQEIIESEEVEGRRNGSLTDKRGFYKDIIFDIDCRMISKKNINYKKSELLKWVNNIEDNRIFFKDNINKCFKVKYASIKTLKQDDDIIDFTINFKCNPFFYDTCFKQMVIKEETQTKDLTISNCNFGDLPSYPKIKIYLPELSTDNFIKIIRYPEEKTDYWVFFNPSRMEMTVSPNCYKVEIDMEDLTAYEFFYDQYGYSYKKSISHKLKNGGYFDIKEGNFELYIQNSGENLKVELDKNQIYLY